MNHIKEVSIVGIKIIDEEYRRIIDPADPSADRAGFLVDTRPHDAYATIWFLCFENREYEIVWPCSESMFGEWYRTIPKDQITGYLHYRYAHLLPKIYDYIELMAM